MNTYVIVNIDDLEKDTNFWRMKLLVILTIKKWVEKKKANHIFIYSVKATKI